MSDNTIIIFVKNKVIFLQDAKVEIKYKEDEMKKDVAPSITYMNKRYEVTDSKGADQVAKLKYTQTFKTTTTFSKTKGFTFTGSFTGGKFLLIFYS